MRFVSEKGRTESGTKTLAAKKSEIKSSPNTSADLHRKELFAKTCNGEAASLYSECRRLAPLRADGETFSADRLTICSKARYDGPACPAKGLHHSSSAIIRGLPKPERTRILLIAPLWMTKHWASCDRLREALGSDALCRSAHKRGDGAGRELRGATDWNQ